MKNSLLLILASVSLSVWASPKVIYGEDNRRDVFQANPAYQKYAQATLARIDRNYGLKGWTFKKMWELNTSTLLQDGVCAEEAFSNQPTVAGCTAFLVSPKHIVTAGHCIGEQSCKVGLYYWLFDYQMPENGPFVNKKPKKNFVSCERIVKRVLDPKTHMDYTLIEIKQKVLNREPLKFRRSGKPSIGDELVVVGHPSGLPTKIADGAQIRDINDVFLTANLDTFGGNSGSPVINVNSGEVEGILVRGANDYVQDTEAGCKRSAHLSNEESYESATLITNIAELMDLN